MLSIVRLPAAEPAALDAETLRQFQALVRMDTSDPPGDIPRFLDQMRALINDPAVTVELAAAKP